MRINILQHTPNEGPGSIASWAFSRGHELFVYHPYFFDGVLPTADETDLLIILGGPMSPNDDLPWIAAERTLIKALLKQNKPIFGACYGAQQIAKFLGANISQSPFKEVGWADIYRQTDRIPNLPEKLSVLHWHEEMFDIPKHATLLFSSELVKNQGYLYRQNVVGLQCHLEPQQSDVNEVVVNDYPYALVNNALKQTAEDIRNFPIPKTNQAAMYAILDFMTLSSHQATRQLK